MNITKEIKLLINDKKDSENILNDLIKEEIELENKIHTFRVLHTAKQYEELRIDGQLKKNRIFSVELDLFFYKKNKNTSISLKDINGNILNKENIDKNLYEKFQYWDNGISASKTKYGSKSPEVNLIFDESFKEKFIDFMLAEELKSILNSTVSAIELEKEMPVNNINNNKHKI